MNFKIGLISAVALVGSTLVGFASNSSHIPAAVKDHSQLEESIKETRLKKLRKADLLKKVDRRMNRLQSLEEQFAKEQMRAKLKKKRARKSKRSKVLSSHVVEPAKRIQRTRTLRSSHKGS